MKQVFTDRGKDSLQKGKPQSLEIHFFTFKRLKGSIDVHSNVSLFEVKEKLGHRYIANTEKYVRWNRELYQQADRHHSASVFTDEEAGKLVEAGWQYVCNNQTTGTMLFRKPK